MTTYTLYLHTIADLQSTIKVAPQTTSTCSIAGQNWQASGVAADKTSCKDNVVLHRQTTRLIIEPDRKHAFNDRASCPIKTEKTICSAARSSAASSCNSNRNPLLLQHTIGPPCDQRLHSVCIFAAAVLAEQHWRCQVHSSSNTVMKFTSTARQLPSARSK